MYTFFFSLSLSLSNKRKHISNNRLFFFFLFVFFDRYKRFVRQIHSPARFSNTHALKRIHPHTLLLYRYYRTCRSEICHGEKKNKRATFLSLLSHLPLAVRINRNNYIEVNNRSQSGNFATSLPSLFFLFLFFLILFYFYAFFPFSISRQALSKRKNLSPRKWNRRDSYDAINIIIIWQYHPCSKLCIKPCTKQGRSKTGVRSIIGNIANNS